jgi:hypothetical protein
MTDLRAAIAGELERGLAESVSFFKSLSPDELWTQVYPGGAENFCVTVTGSDTMAC